MMSRLTAIVRKTTSGHRVKLAFIGIVVLVFFGFNFDYIWPALYARVLASRGNNAYEQGRFDDAEVFYKMALRKSPGLWFVQYNLANAYYREERYAEACNTYRQVLSNPGNVLKVEAWNNLGNARYKQGQLNASLQAYQKALVLGNGSPKIRQDYLFVLRKIQQQKTRRAGDKKDKMADENKPGSSKPDNKGNDGKSDNPDDKKNQDYQLSDKNLTELFKKIERDEDAARNRISKAKRKNKAPVSDGPDY